MKRRLKFAPLVLFASISVGMAGPSQADTLADTLVKAYQLSPALDAARASVRALDEGVAQAGAGKRPSVGMTFDLRSTWSENRDILGAETGRIGRSRRLNAEVSATQNIYDGGRTKAAVAAANAQVSAGRAELKNAEQSLFLNAVAAYVDVRRDLQFVSLGRSNVSVLNQQVQAARDRFELGEVTRTDVSLAEARRAAAEAQLVSFRGQLDLSEEDFRAVVGVPPSNLQPPPALPALPKSLDEAIAIAMRENPNMIASRFQEQAALHNLERARANRRFTVDAGASVGVANSGNLNLFDDDESTASYTLSLTARQQLYSGGALVSAERQALQALAQQKYLLQDTARQVQRSVAGAWAGLEIARASISANRKQVQAAEVTFEGVREEARLGARTTLDVLDREQELRDAQVQLASSQRDLYVRAYELLASMGLLTLEHLNLGIESYDPNEYYEAVKNAPVITPRGAKLDKLLQKYRP